MKLVTKIKFTIETEVDKPLEFDLVYSQPKNKDVKKFKKMHETALKKFFEREKEREAINKKIQSSDDEKDMSKLVKEISEKPQVTLDDEFNNIAKKELEILVSGYDDKLIEILDEYVNGYTLAMEEIRVLHREAIAKK